ncbi:hypothetical protein B0T10DRAFT_201872 [Thelonectria olida]|uniref:Uncharacterized protein n=1 Tax=Thelonectria olida TaxID=1576542 RepID=A0A9P8VTB3_9HYPO|nr:hypothetical protein B0T10DRAFT_201872 [Thelonectria olida]
MSLAEPADITPSGRYAEAILAEDRLNNSTPRASDFAGEEVSQTEDTKKAKKRSLFGFGKKKAPVTKKSTDSSKSDTRSLSPSKSNSATTSPPLLSRDGSKLSTTQSSTWATQGDQAFVLPSSPGRGFSGSPRLSSPATSQIFERDVQESAVLGPNSPAIPTHIQTENHIPAVLDDASEAITNEKLDPDSVEIVTHTSHQPAAVTVTGTAPYDQTASEWAAELASFADREAFSSADNASNYGSLDSSDVRRLSFISFADVVQAEHGSHSAVPGSRDSIHLVGLTSLPAAVNRSPSPIRSPVSSQGPETSPPTSNPGSMKGIELSPTRRPLGSPTSLNNLNVNLPSGDLNIETMSQALRRTGSTDLSNVRSGPASPIETSVPR